MLVEGPYDRQRLSALSNLFNEDKLVLIPFGTDALVKKNYFLEYEDRIKEVLNKEKTNDYSDFDEIVQICDTDGCFIDESFVVEDEKVKHITYESNRIRVVDYKSVEKPRQNKRENIDKLLESKIIKLFYNSTNIDHTFDGIQNPTDNQKRTKAIQMYNRYKNDGESFIKDLIRLCPVHDGFEESWDYIKKDFNSLGQYTNLIYFIIDHIDSLKDEYKELLEESDFLKK